MNGRPNLSPRTRKTALLGMLAAAALALSFLENLIPGLPGLPPGRPLVQYMRLAKSVVREAGDQKK